MPRIPTIDNAFFGSIIIDGQKYSNDLIVSWDGEIRERERNHNFSKNDLAELMMKEPEAIIVGTGNSGLLQVDPALRVSANLNGTELIVAKTPEAAKHFNSLARTRKKVIAVLHATC